VDPHRVRAQLLDRYNIEIAAGFGTPKDQVWRIGLMGYSSRPENVTLFLAALNELIRGLAQVNTWARRGSAERAMAAS
jgi:alanine-glyoxylate transaminase/serine-glyoxylate transaminase/serine-pyruvate transaminase